MGAIRCRSPKSRSRPCKTPIRAVAEALENERSGAFELAMIASRPGMLLLPMVLGCTSPTSTPVRDKPESEPKLPAACNVAVSDAQAAIELARAAKLLAGFPDGHDVIERSGLWCQPATRQGAAILLVLQQPHDVLHRHPTAWREGVFYHCRLALGM